MKSLAVNGQVIDDQLIRNEAGILKERLKAEMPDADSLELELRAREWARENVIQRVLLEQAAMQEPESLPGDDGPQDSGMDRRVERLMLRVTAQAPRPKPQEVADYYRRHKESFRVPELVQAAHIVKNVDESATEAQAETAIREIEAELNNGADFAELADRRSDCPGSGGNLGFFSRGQMVEEFDNVIFALRPGEVSGVFRSTFGFHIAKLADRRPPGTLSLNQAREHIEMMLWDQRKQQVAMEFLGSLRDKAEIRKIAV
jgi:parvulin-like peptidyl-prolyl isomerase